MSVTHSDVGVPSVLGYVRVSTTEQADSGLGLAAQEAAIRAECERRGWALVGVVEDAGYSGSNVDRPGLTYARERLRTGKAGTLVVSRLDRLSRSLMDFATLMEEARRESWTLVALDLGVDTSTPSGILVANVMASFAEYERHLIGQRTRDALAEKRAQGVRLGRPRSVPDDVRACIRELRASGLPWQRVADVLNRRGVPTGQGGARWHANTARRIALAS